MTDQERYDALFNVWIAVGVARGYLGIGTPRNRSVTPEQLDAALARAEDTLSELTMQPHKAEISNDRTSPVTATTPPRDEAAEESTTTAWLAPSDKMRRLVHGINQMEKVKQYVNADALLEQLWALEQDVPDGLHPGRLISLPVDDGYATYVVESVPSDRCSVLRVGGEQHFKGVHEDGTCDLQVVQHAIAEADRDRILARECEARREQKQSQK